MSRLISQFFRNLISSKNFTCPLSKLITEFTSPIGKSTGPGLSDTTFFACCIVFFYILEMLLVYLTFHYTVVVLHEIIPSVASKHVHVTQ